MRPFSRSSPRSSSSSLMRSSLERLISISEVQRSSGIFAIVRSRVTPALWTTMSTPVGERRRRSGRGASSSVMSSSIVSASSRSATSSRSSASAGTSSRTRSAPSRCRVVAIASPMPREAPVTRAVLPSSGRAQSISGAFATPGADLDHLAGDVGRAGREQEAHRRLDLRLGALGDVDELHGDAAADLLAERAGEALQRPLRRRRAGRQAGRRGAEHDDAAGALHSLHVGVEEALQLDQLGRVGDAGRVEDERLDRRCPISPAAAHRAPRAAARAACRAVRRERRRPGLRPRRPGRRACGAPARQAGAGRCGRRSAVPAPS